MTMPDLLTGVDLQRAIAEKKGWKSCQVLDGILLGISPDTGYTNDVPDWHTRVAYAHDLLAELVAEGCGWVLRYNPLTKTYKVTCVSFTHRKDTTVEAPSFCTAVGNLWLECVG